MSWSIRAIWENYAGWFKHESTTELYSVPQKAIHAELVQLAGADAMVQLAGRKAAAGEHEQALHLLDIVLPLPLRSASMTPATDGGSPGIASPSTTAPGALDVSRR